jgi:hypothetical protein
MSRIKSFLNLLSQKKIVTHDNGLNEEFNNIISFMK